MEFEFFIAGFKLDYGVIVMLLSAGFIFTKSKLFALIWVYLTANHWMDKWLEQNGLLDDIDFYSTFLLLVNLVLLMYLMTKRLEQKTEVYFANIIALLSVFCLFFVFVPGIDAMIAQYTALNISIDQYVVYSHLWIMQTFAAMFLALGVADGGRSGFSFHNLGYWGQQLQHIGDRKLWHRSVNAEILAHDKRVR